MGALTGAKELNLARGKRGRLSGPAGTSLLRLAIASVEKDLPLLLISSLVELLFISIRPYIRPEVSKAATIELADGSNDRAQAATRRKRRSDLPEQSLLPPERPKWKSFAICPRSLD